MHNACGTVLVPGNVSQCALIMSNLWNGYAIDNRTFDDQVSTTSSLSVSWTSQTTVMMLTEGFNIDDDDEVGSHSTVVTGGSGRSVDLETIVQLYVISLLIVFGIVGNIVSIIVLRQDRERRDTLFLLQALAVADALYLLAAVMRYPVKHFIKTQSDGSNAYVNMQPIVFPLLKTFQTVAVWMMVLVTIDRFCCVCRPLDAPRWFNTSSRPKYAVAVLVAGCIYNIPRFFDSCVYRIVDQCRKFSHAFMIYREAFNNIYYFNGYIDGLTILLVYIVPLTALVVMTIRLIRAIRQSRRRRRCQEIRTSSSRTWSPSNEVIMLQQRQQHQHQQLPQQHIRQQQQQQLLQSVAAPSSTSSDRNATVVLVIIVVVFIVCETPELIHRLITFFERNIGYGLDYVQHGQSLRILGIVSELFMVVNSSVNFVVYVAFGRRFRRIMRETFRFSFRFSSDVTAVTRDSPQGAAAGAAAVGNGGGAQHHPGGVRPGYHQPLLPHHQNQQPQYPMRFNYAASPGVRQHAQCQRGPPPQAIMMRAGANYNNFNGL